MEVTEINDRRFDTALGLLKEGETDLVFNDVSFFLDRERKVLAVASLTTWGTNVNEHTARADIQRGIETFEYLSKHSPQFAKVVKGYLPRFSLISAYGSGDVELCYLSEGKIVWF